MPGLKTIFRVSLFAVCLAGILALFPRLPAPQTLGTQVILSEARQAVPPCS